MNKTNLAKALGISRSRLYQCIEKGMTTESVELAQEWRDRNIDFTLTYPYRYRGNTGRVERKQQPDKDIKRIVTEYILTDLIPRMWFEQVGWLGSVLKDTGVKITAEQLLRAQQCLLVLYMSEIDEYFQEEAIFSIGTIMNANPGDDIYLSLIERLKEILEE